MIDIEIKPAAGTDGGYYTAKGHAAKGHEAVCEAVTVIANCLAANLEDTWDVKVDGDAQSGSCWLRWHKTDRRGKGLERANLAAAFAYKGLRALARAWPEDVTVKWRRPERFEARKEGKK